MASDKKRIIFISHDSSLTGAPILLLNLISLIKKRDSFYIQIILCRGGILENEFRKLGEITVLKSRNYHKQNLIFRGINFLIYKSKLFFLKLKIKNSDIIFNNTIANGKVLKTISSSGAKIITYVHELESIIQEFQSEANLTFKYSDLYICPSNAVAHNLISKHNIINEKVSYLNYYFPFAQQDIHESAKINAQKAFEGFLQFSENKFYVVGMGSATYRKGIDIFVNAARITNKTGKQIHFVWIGDFVDNEMKEKIMGIMATYQLNDIVTIVGQVQHSLKTLLPFDLFILCSREDPYPLVVLEAALVKIPSVCFADTGGIQEFISNDCGWIVDEISAEMLSNKIIEIKNKKEEIKRRGENAFEKCVKMHTDENLIHEQINTILQKVNKL
jgi:glycosyltransferase involved in cell wall biosynthesis